MKKNIKVLVIEIVVIALAIIGVALAINYLMDSIGITASTADLAVTYTGSTTLPSTSLAPVNDSEATYNTANTSIMKVDFTIKGAAGNPEKPIIYDVILDELDVSCYLKNEILKWKLFKNGTQLTTGNFSPTFDVMKDNKLFLTTIQQDLPSSSSTADSYQLLVWISESCTSSDITTCTKSQDQSNMLGETISGKVQAVLYTDSKKTLTRTTGSVLQCTRENAPDLINGLIPVKYSNITNSWVKADSNNTDDSWYNYKKRKWANAVLVSSTNRSTYQSAAVGTSISEDDVLAYYVWIPRYKYKVWNINKVIGTDSYDAETKGIDIIFEQGIATTGTVKCNNYSFAARSLSTLNETCSGSNGDYYTHPAFRFGTTELKGIWVGKFELSSSDPNATYGGGNTINLTPRIKPNVVSWKNNKIDNYWKVIHDMQVSNNIYGLASTTNADSHLIKNIEWGAVSYLTHSKYGVCSNGVCDLVYKNNSSDSITGNSGEEPNAPSISGITLAYNENKRVESVSGGNSLVLSEPVNDATYPWVKSDGTWSSGNSGVANSTTNLTYSFTNSSDAVLKLVFSVSGHYNNFFSIFLDGVKVVEMSGDLRGTSESSLKYDTFFYKVGSGTHTLQARYTNATSVSGLDKAYIKSLEVFDGASLVVTHTNELGGQMASTNHNESGIYDMSGGVHDYVMGNASSSENSYVYNQGTSGTNYTYSSKYTDSYAYTDGAMSQLYYNGSILGDATGEVAISSTRVFGDASVSGISNTLPFYCRGNHWFGSTAGIFGTSRGGGSTSTAFTTRAALVSLS